MHVFLIIFGGLLVLFGGGCALMWGAMSIQSLGLNEEYWAMMPMLSMVGIAITFAGGLMVRAGIRARRAKLQARADRE